MTTQSASTPAPLTSGHPLLALTWKDDGSFGLEVHWGILVGLAVLIVAFFIWRLWESRASLRNLFITESEIGVGPAKFTLKPDYQDRQLAFAIWSELATRRASLPFDENSILLEIYNSLYEFFGRTRELLQTIPVERLDRQSTRSIVEATVSLLNDGKRPHMTKWGTHFRAWYNLEMEKAKADKQGLTAHELQVKFPRYKELIADLKLTNEKLVVYKDQLYQLAAGSKSTASS